MLATSLTAAAATIAPQRDVQPLLDTLVQVCGSLASAIAYTDGAARTFAVGVPLVADFWIARRAALLTQSISGSKALIRTALARRGKLWTERAIGDGGFSGEGLRGVSATLAVTGPATLDEDLEVARAIGFAPDGIAERLRSMGDDGETRERVVRTTIFSGEPGRDAEVELGFVGRAPDPLGFGTPTSVRCSARATVVTYRDVPRARVRMLAGDSAAAVDAFIAAVGATHLSIDVALDEPRTIRVGVRE